MKVILRGHPDTFYWQARAAKYALLNYPDNKKGDFIVISYGDLLDIGIRWNDKSISIYPQESGKPTE